MHDMNMYHSLRWYYPDQVYANSQNTVSLPSACNGYNLSLYFSRQSRNDLPARHPV